MAAQVGLVGRVVGGDVELQRSAAGKAYVKLTVETRPRSAKGAPAGPAAMHNLVAFGRLAHHVAETVRRGDLVLAVGRFNDHQWTGRDGQVRTSTSLVCDGLGLDLNAGPARLAGPDDDEENQE